MVSYLEFFQNDFKLVFPEIYISLSILFLLTMAVFLNTSKKTSIETISWLSIEVLLITGILIINNPFYNSLVLSGMVMVDNLTSLVKFIIVISASIVIFMGFQYFVDEKISYFEFGILILLATLGMMLLISSYDFIIMYLAIELQSLSLYILATLKRDSQFSTEAGLKYFILGALSSGILLFGCSLIYGLTGTTNFESLNHLLINSAVEYNEISTAISIGIAFIAVALFFKIAAAPFHMWAPDVYEGAPMIVTAFFAIVPKIAILGLFIELFLETFYGLVDQWQQIIIFSAMTSMIIGAIGAIEQKKIKRLLAYSAIGHIGYILIALSSATVEGIQSLLIYIIIYIIMSISIFSIALSLYKKIDHVRITYISELTGLAKENPLLAISLAITVLSMAGIPPLAGFASKLYVFYSAIVSSMYVLAIIGVLTSVIAAVYYIRLIKIMYFENNNSHSYLTMDIQKSLIISSTFLFLVTFLFNPSFLFILTHEITLNFSL